MEKFKIYNKSKNLYTIIEFKKITAMLKQEIKKEKKDKFKKFIEEINPNTKTKEIWNKIAKLNFNKYKDKANFINDSIKAKDLLRTKILQSRTFHI